MSLSTLRMSATFALTALVALAAAAPTTKPYSLIASYQGNDFFNHFTTFTGQDPTNGFVNYTDMAFAAQNGLVGFVENQNTNSTTAYIGVDHKNLAPNGRNSVRLLGKDTFNAGSLAVIDVRHIPVQYGLWPAIWFLGTSEVWPGAGESDILEYVNKDDFTATTLHTAPGCSVSNTTKAMQGNLLGANCNADDASTGCSIHAPTAGLTVGSQKIATAGADFNTQGGGVFVHDWQPDGITVWLFPHSSLPADLVAGKPNPSSWTQKPLAKFSGACDFETAFKDMQLIINIEFAGSWAGNVWASSGSAKATGVDSVNDWIANNPTEFKDSYFEIGGVQVYSNNGQKPGVFTAIPSSTVPPSVDGVGF